MRWHLITPLEPVDSNSTLSVDREPLVGVDSDTEESGVGVNQSLHVSSFQVEQDRGLVQVGQIGHVFTHVKLGRVDLPDLLLLVVLLLEEMNCILGNHFFIKANITFYSNYYFL